MRGWGVLFFFICFELCAGSCVRELKALKGSYTNADLRHLYYQIDRNEKNLPVLDPKRFKTVIETERLLLVSYQYRVKKQLFFALSKSTLVPVGMIELGEGKKYARAPIFVHSDSRKLGFGTEMKKAILEYAAKFRGIKKFKAQILPDNEASIKLHEGLGFKFYGTWDVYNIYYLN